MGNSAKENLKMGKNNSETWECLLKIFVTFEKNIKHEVQSKLASLKSKLRNFQGHHRQLQSVNLSRAKNVNQGKTIAVY